MPHCDKPDALNSGNADRLVHCKPPCNVAEPMSCVQPVDGRCNRLPLKRGGRADQTTLQSVNQIWQPARYAIRIPSSQIGPYQRLSNNCRIFGRTVCCNEKVNRELFKLFSG